MSGWTTCRYCGERLNGWSKERDHKAKRHPREVLVEAIYQATLAVGQAEAWIQEGQDLRRELSLVPAGCPRAKRYLERELEGFPHYESTRGIAYLEADLKMARERLLTEESALQAYDAQHQPIAQPS